MPKNIQRKTADRNHVAMQLKALDDTGRFAGYASVFNVVDSQRDIVLRGAFTKTLMGRIREIKLLWQHQQDEPIGVFDHIFEDARGLYVEGRLLLKVRRAEEAHMLLKSGALNGLSIGYSPVKFRVDKKTGVRSISEVHLWEVSLVTFPANEAANVTVVKQAGSQIRDKLQAHTRELRRLLAIDSFEQDTRGPYMTLTESLERSRALRSLRRKSRVLLQEAIRLSRKRTKAKRLRQPENQD